jgi:carbamoylphosphate synthase large subunit
MVPRVLIFHTLDWPNAARLAIAFRAADCRVDALCRRAHPLRVVSCVDRIHAFSLFSPLNSLRTAIENSQPDFVVPCDDTAVAHLHRLHREETTSSKPTAISMLIERSLGDPRAYQQLALRSQLPDITAETGALLPRTRIVQSVDELRAWTKEIGYPAVLKTDRSWGGEGVVIAQNAAHAEAAFAAMSRRPGVLRAMKRVLLNLDPNLFFRKFTEAPPTISVQEFIAGTLANTAAACWQGETLATLSVEVVASFCELGSSTVVHPVQNIQMRQTAEEISRKLGISGFCGFDFILDEKTGQAFLLEINPRATQINHLVLGNGHDLPGALRAKIAGEPARQAVSITSAQTISLFPQEFKRDPSSSFLSSGYHDIPWEEPALIQAFQSAPTPLRRSRVGGLAYRYLRPKQEPLPTLRE